MDDQATFDVDCFVAMPRVTSLAVAPDGSRLVASVERVATDGKKFVTSLWGLDPRGQAAPRQLTRSAPGESHAAFLPDGSILFTSTRADPDAPAPGKDDEKERSRLWLLPATGGEPRVVAAPPGGITGAVSARDAGRIVYGVRMWPTAATAEEDEERQTARTEAGVTAQLFDTYPIRFWDHYLGPRRLHLFFAEPPPANDPLDEPRDLVADPGVGFSDPQGGWTVSPDGRTVISSWWLQLARGEQRSELVAFDVETGARRVLASEDHTSFSAPTVSWDGTKVAFVRNPFGTFTEPFRIELLVADLATGETRELGADVDVWFNAPVWSHDGRAVFAVADQLATRRSSVSTSRPARSRASPRAGATPLFLSDRTEPCTRCAAA